MPVLESRGLVARCRAGDDDAWRELVERHARYVHAIAVRAYGLQPADAEDVFQETFARAYEHLDRLRDDDAIGAWIGQVSRRLALARVRARARESPAGTDGLPERAEPDRRLERLDEALTVHAAMDALAGPCREVLDRFSPATRAPRRSAWRWGYRPGRWPAASRAASGGCARNSWEETRRLRALDGMDSGTVPSETELAELISELPPAPAGWVRAAVELPRLRRELDRLAALCMADADVRAHTLADLERALRDAGLRATPVAVRLARERLQ